jgi:calcineurin-like phosphoesterase family protein
MADTYYVGDLHLGHAGIIKFLDNKGNRIRPFESIEEHDETLISNFNALVKPADRVYFLGDLVINRKCLPMLARFNGRKKLIKGNHDIFKMADYLPYFEDIQAYRIYPKQSIIMSHIPVHPGNLEYRFKWNVHGHLHSNVVTKRSWLYRMVPDPRYINLCPEHTSFKPVNFDTILEMIKQRS